MTLVYHSSYDALHKIFQTSGKMHTCTHQLSCFPPCSPYCLADSPLQTLGFLRVHLWCSSYGCSHPAGLAAACFYGLIAVSVPWRTTTIVGFAETPLIPNPHSWKAYSPRTRIPPVTKNTNSESKAVLCAASELHFSHVPCQMLHRERRRSVKCRSSLAIPEWVFEPGR